MPQIPNERESNFKIGNRNAGWYLYADPYGRYQLCATQGRTLIRRMKRQLQSWVLQQTNLTPNSIWDPTWTERFYDRLTDEGWRSSEIPFARSDPKFSQHLLRSMLFYLDHRQGGTLASVRLPPSVVLPDLFDAPDEDGVRTDAPPMCAYISAQRANELLNPAPLAKNNPNLPKYLAIGSIVVLGAATYFWLKDST